jgi:hypothetical protein
MVRKLVFSLLIVLLLIGGLRAINSAFVDVVTGNARWVFLPLGTALALPTGAAVAWFASARSGVGVTGTLVAATLFSVIAGGYVLHLATPSAPPFGAAATLRPGTAHETYPARGTHAYQVNAFGFRGPSWTLAKAPNTVRGVVIGDSMVFGAGVDDGDTIDATLADQLRRVAASKQVEMLNLGVPGSNLPNYVELYRAAEERLEPDFVVLCLFLPNDAGELEQPSLERRLGFYSFFQFLLGQQQNPYTSYAMRSSEARSEEAKLAFLAHHLEAIEAIRRSPLFIFFYWQEPAWTKTARASLGDGAWIVDHPPLPESDFIPGDSHPTASGNRHFAEIIGDAIERSPAASILFGRGR